MVEEEVKTRELVLYREPPTTDEVRYQMQAAFHVARRVMRALVAERITQRQLARMAQFNEVAEQIITDYRLSSVQRDTGPGTVVTYKAVAPEHYHPFQFPMSLVRRSGLVAAAYYNRMSNRHLYDSDDEEYKGKKNYNNCK
jgi:hypothetical protein